MTLEEIFYAAMDELVARDPSKSQVNDVIKGILNQYDLTSEEEAKLTEELLSNY